MQTVKITIDDNLSFSKLKSALSLIAGVKSVELSNSSTKKHTEAKRGKIEKGVKAAFFSTSRQAMTKRIEKYL